MFSLRNDDISFYNNWAAKINVLLQLKWSKLITSIFLIPQSIFYFLKVTAEENVKEVTI